MRRSPSPNCSIPTSSRSTRCGKAKGLHFFVMRYVQGRSLEQVIERAGKLPLPIVRSILHQVGAALTYAHRARVIHRDIKPANILIDTDGNAVVTDFGIAKAAESPTRTITGALVGTPAYMSPEQCSGVRGLRGVGPVLRSVRLPTRCSRACRRSPARLSP